jgi:hypothetical protein
MPKKCPLPGCDYVDDRPETEGVVTPFLSKKNRLGADRTYRMMEEGSIQRAKMAAAETGLPESEFAHLKITNMKDNLREGEIAAMEPAPNPVSERMALMQQHNLPVGMGAVNAQSFRGVAASGPEPYAGLRAVTKLKQAHGSSGHVVTENPGLR